MNDRKHAVITGSTRGIGFALAEEFLRRGWKVTINGTSDESVSTAVDKLSRFSGQLLGFRGNAASFGDMDSLWQTAVDRQGPVHVWVNNAGIDQRHFKPWDISTEELSNIVNINILGVIYGTKVAALGMIRQGFGKIFNMEGFGSSGMMRPYLSLYGTTKRAVRYFSRSSSREAEGCGMLIGTLSPGMVVTDFVRNSLKDRPEDAEQTKKIFNILGNKPEEIASFLVNGMIKAKKQGTHIEWLPKWKIILRFMAAPVRKNRNLFEET
jgi:NAD(P)-dependent dehydrogenase (short-subunit alcohol dehydrogenase family)